MNVITTEKLRRNLTDVIDDIRLTGKHLIVERYGKQMVAIIPIEDLEVSKAKARDNLRKYFAEAAARGVGSNLANDEIEQMAVEAVREVREERYQQKMSK